jgi:hypothetical protein
MFTAFASRPSDHLLPIRHGNFSDLRERLLRSPNPLIGGEAMKNGPGQGNNWCCFWDITVLLSRFRQSRIDCDIRGVG